MKILEIHIVKTNSKNVAARADIQFEGFIIKGFKVIQDLNSHKLYVTPPSYYSPAGWRPLFKTDSVDDWQLIQSEVLKRFELYEIEEFVNEGQPSNNTK